MEGKQLRGNCQLCGREQAVQRGRMAKHGYTVEYGYFRGVCSGHDFAPMQVDRVQADNTVRFVRMDARNLRERAARLRAGETHPMTVPSGRYKVDPIAWEDASDHQRATAVEAAIRATEHRAREADQFADFLAALADQVHGKPLIEVDRATDGVKVGSMVKVRGKVVEVVAIEYATARGIGPGVNGRSVEHVYWLDANGKRVGYPKRYARLAG